MVVHLWRDIVTILLCFGQLHCAVKAARGTAVGLIPAVVSVSIAVVIGSLTFVRTW